MYFFGVNQSELASAIGIAKRSVQRLESGTDMPRYTTLFKIADVLSVEPEVFVRPMWLAWKKEQAQQQ